MPLPSDTKVVETSHGLVQTLRDIFGPDTKYRPVHAKGILLKGTFEPTEKARSLSKAPHFNSNSTPVLARFSSSTGIPEIPDTDPNGNPRGLSIRFVLANEPRRLHTDIVAHSVDGFPGSTGEEALEFFKAVKDGTLGDYLSSHPKAAAFVQTPKPTPSSFGREKYFGVNAFRFIAADGKQTYIRYRIVPVAGEEYLDEATLKGKSPDFLYDEVSAAVSERLPVEFRLVAQIAQAGDVTDDSAVKWPEETRELVDLGLIKLDGLADEQAAQQKHIIFDPIPRVDGIEPSGDPLLQVRAGVYLISGKERRGATG